MNAKDSVLITAPELGHAHELITAALHSRHLLLLVGRCKVMYEGRASSSLTEGDRVLMIKTDGSVLVHRPSGAEPVNWQPSKCSIKPSLSKGELMISASRVRPRETLTVSFSRLASLGIYDLEDSGIFSMYVSEEQVQQAILLRPSLVENGIKPIASQKQFGDSGFTDVLAEDPAGSLVVIEIKRTPAGRDAVLQLGRYIDEIRRDVQRPLRGILASPGLKRGTQQLLESMKLEYRRISPERCYEVLRHHNRTKISDFFSKEEK